MSRRGRIQLSDAEQNIIANLFQVRGARIKLDVDEIRAGIAASEISESVFNDHSRAIEVRSRPQFEQLVITSKI